MVPPEEHPRHSCHGHPDGFPAEEIRQCEVEGRVRLPQEVLEEHDEECTDVRGVGSRGQDAREGEPEDERGRFVRCGACEEQVAGVEGEEGGRVFEGHCVLYAGGFVAEFGAYV